MTRLLSFLYAFLANVTFNNVYTALRLKTPFALQKIHLDRLTTRGQHFILVSHP